MYRIEQVLVPVDFSSFSASALQFARQISGEEDDNTTGVKLQLAHAVDALPEYVRRLLFPYAPLGEDDRDFEAEIRAAAARKLQEYFEIDDALRERFVGEPIVEFGAPGECVQQWATSVQVDLIVAGAYGKTGVFAGGPGSTSRRLVGASAVPVALVRDFEPRPRVDRVLAAVDLGRDSERVIEVGCCLAECFDATLDLVHVVASPFAHDTNWQVERALEMTKADCQAQLVERAEENLQRLVEDLELPFAREQQLRRRLDDTSVVVGDPANQIGKKADDGDADLVVIGAGQRGGKAGVGPGRVVSAVMAQVPRHQVIVPGHYERTPLG